MTGLCTKAVIGRAKVGLRIYVTFKQPSSVPDKIPGLIPTYLHLSSFHIVPEYVYLSILRPLPKL